MLEVNNICKSFKGFSLKNISFQLPDGYIMGYVGQNGAGKTTTINIISGLMKESAGEIKLNGITCRENPAQYKEMIGYVGDEAYLPLELKVGNVRSILKSFYPTFRGEEFDRMIQEWKLPGDKKIKDFSKGMKVRLMFAAALSRETKILILDEATSGLDPVVRCDILTLLQKYIEDGRHSVLFSTHILNDLEQIADYIYFIDDGSEVMCELKDDMVEKYVLVKGGNDELTNEGQERLIGIVKSGVGFEAIAESSDSVYLPKGFLIEKPSIDQIVIHMIRQKGGEK